MALFSYIKNIILLAFVLALIMLLYPFFANDAPLEFYYRDSIIYTTQGTAIVGGTFCTIVIFSALKILYLLISEGFFVRTIIMHLVTPFINIRKRKMNILEHIIALRKKGQYRQALQITTNNFQNSNEILFQHFFLLLKLRKTMKFVNTFKNHQCGKAIPLFFALTQDWSEWRKSLIIARMYKKNPNNDVIAYIYAKHLVDTGHTELAGKIVEDFIENKFVFFREQYTFYLFNKLALQLEIKEYGNTDFATDYIENIKSYHNAHLQKKYKEKR